MNSFKPWDIYARQLIPLGYGYPLLYPEHPNEHGHGPADIGDVGVIVEGKFTPFFNVVNKESPLNIVSNQRSYAKKPDFVQLMLYSEMLDRTDIRISEGIVRNEEEKTLNLEGGGGVGECVILTLCSFSLTNATTLSASGTTGVGVGGNIRVGSSKQEGACLVLKTPGVGRRILPGCQAFRRYAIEQERHWSKYFKSMDYDHTIPGITLITGVITTTAWGIAAYTGGTEVREINFNAPVGMLASAGAKILFQNKNLPNMTLREGPSTLPERLKGTLEADSRDPAATGDQNVFLQFVRIRYRFLGLWRVIRAEGSKKSDDGRQYSPEPELEPDEQPVRISIWGTSI